MVNTLLRGDFFKSVSAVFGQLFLGCLLMQNALYSQTTEESDSIFVKYTDDFEFNFSNEVWEKADWIPLSQIRGEEYAGYYTKVKMLYSKTGIYFRFECGDSVISADYDVDFEKLWEQDVVEVFIHPEIESNEYFEYELSPRNKELVLFVSNYDKDLSLWMPYLYHDRVVKTKHQTDLSNKKADKDSIVDQWDAIIYIPYALMRPLKNIRPVSGTRWKINFYRIDYDHEETKWWSWKFVDKGFHEYKKFGNLIFE